VITLTGSDNVSLVAAGDSLLALTAGGELLVLKRSPAKFAITATYPVAQAATWSHLPPLPDGVLVKDQNVLTRWRFR
jgi:hypothetical protein